MKRVFCLENHTQEEGPVALYLDPYFDVWRQKNNTKNAMLVRNQWSKIKNNTFFWSVEGQN